MIRPGDSAQWLEDDADASSADSLLEEAAGVSEPASATALSFALLPGEILDERFVVERLASAGGMGAIYRGFERGSREPVAIKVVVGAGVGAIRRFAREAAVLSELSHPAIVRYLGQGTTAQGTLFLAMEWLEGEDLAARLRRTPLSVADSLTVVRRACEGLAVAHARSIVHRDIKPSNLFLVERQAAALKVLDFGVARQPDTSRTVTRSGAVLGTVGYMSPEQAIGPRDVDARADVFALGCVLFECLTGRAAFTGENAVAVLANLLHASPPRITELRPELDERLATLVASMLAKNPSARPADAAAILRALDDDWRAPVATRHMPRRSLIVGGLAAASVVFVLGSRRTDAPAQSQPPSGRDTQSQADSLPLPRPTAAPPEPEPPAAVSSPNVNPAPARVKSAHSLPPPRPSASTVRQHRVSAPRPRGLIEEVPF